MPQVEERRTLPGTMVEVETLHREIRLAAYGLVNSFLTEQQILSDYLGLKPVQVTVYLTVAAATVQRYVRKPELDEKYRGATPLPVDALGSISRRAIASATGLPRETVRRIVSELISSGHLREVGADGVASRFGELVPESTQKYVLMLATEVSRLVDELARLGVIVPR